MSLSTSNSIEFMIDVTFFRLQRQDVTVSFHVAGTSRVRIYVNGNEKAQVTTNIPAAAQGLTPTFHIRNASAAAHVMEIDYIYAAQVR